MTLRFVPLSFEDAPVPRMKDIIADVAVRRGFRYADLIGPRRDRGAVLPRQEAMYEIAQLKDLYGWSYPMIGRAFGGRDHSTVIKGIHSYKKRMGEGCV